MNIKELANGWRLEWYGDSSFEETNGWAARDTVPAASRSYLGVRLSRKRSREKTNDTKS